jgi:hypothetical protein
MSHINPHFMRVTEILADKRDRALVEHTERQRGFAAVAALNWRIETRELIESEVRLFSSRRHGRWVQLPPVDLGTTCQVDLHTDELLPKELGSVELDCEGPASLVYSLHPNGSVAVIASPHTSAHTQRISVDAPARQFIIDVIPHVWDLAGSIGRARVRGHLREFGRLAAVTRARALPTPASGRFLRRLGERAERFAFVFQSPGEARRHRLSQEASLGIGLIAGMMASTIWPFARDYGAEVGTRSAATMAHCKEVFTRGPKFDTCLYHGNYWPEKTLSTTLSTGTLLVFALALTCTALLIVWRIKRQR